jgi:hypothetical protein
MIIIGIDGGKSGGIAIRYPENGTLVYPMPDTAADIFRLFVAGELLKRIHEGEKVHVFFEKAQSMPKMGIAAMFNYGKSVGIIEGMIVALGYAYTLVGPKEWMRVMHLGTDSALGTKERSLQACYRLFPHIDLKPTARCRKDSDGMAEALLIAEYGRRVLQGQTG